MRRLFLAPFAVAVLLLSAPLGADDLVYVRFGSYLDALRVQAGIPGLTAAIIGSDGILWEHGSGYGDIERAIPIRTDTPMHLDGMTEVVTASLVLQCVEEGRLSLDDRIGRFRPGSPDADATIREVLTHTSGPPEGAAYEYRPERFDALSGVIRSCTNDSYRETLANQFDRLAMVDSVPGADVLGLVPPAEGVLTSEFDRYARTLSRLAAPYAVDAQRRATRSDYSATTLKPWTGAISTIQDLAKFDLALKDGLLLQPETLERAWLPPLGVDGQRTPHGIGWFVQSYNGERVVWQFGGGEDGSSSLMVTLPARNMTLILLANSNGLTKSFSLSEGDLTVSPFGRLFLGTFTR